MEINWTDSKLKYKNPEKHITEIFIYSYERHLTTISNRFWNEKFEWISNQQQTKNDHVINYFEKLKNNVVSIMKTYFYTKINNHNNSKWLREKTLLQNNENIFCIIKSPHKKYKK